MADTILKRWNGTQWVEVNPQTTHTQIVASGTPSSTTYLRGDGTWATISDSDTTYTAGSGLSLTGTEFANTAPDQIVALTGSGATTVTGTYPNFTISSTDTNTTYDLSPYAPLASPALTGTPTAPTASSGVNTTQIATTAFVQNALSGVSGGMNFAGSISLATAKNGDNLAAAGLTGPGDYLIVTATGDITNAGATFVTLAVQEPGDEGDFILPVTLETGDWIVYVSGDGSTMTVAIINNTDTRFAAVSHTHSIANVTGLQTALDGKLSLTGGTMTGVITTPNGTHGIIIGDDSRLADRNVGNTLFLEGVQNTDRGYINFSQTTGNALGAINGGALTWRGDNLATESFVTSQGYITSADGGNATTLDNIDSGSFLRSDVDDTMTANLSLDGYFKQGAYYKKTITLNYPGANVGQGRWFVRLWQTSAGATFSGGKIRTGGTWSWANIMGHIEIDYGVYVAASATSISSGSTRFSSGVSGAYDNMRIGDIEVVDGYAGVYIWSLNSNTPYVDFDIYCTREPLFTYVNWAANTMPGQREVEFHKGIDVQGTTILRNRTHIQPPSSGGGQNLFTGLNSDTSDGGRAQLVLSSAYSDLVIASSQVNNVHGSTLTFAAYNPANAADHRKFVINQGNWGTRKQFLEFGYDDSTNLNPHSNISDTRSVMTLDGINKRVGIGTRNPGQKLDVVGNILASGRVYEVGGDRLALAKKGELVSSDLNNILDTGFYYSNANFASNSNYPFANYFTLLNVRNALNDNLDGALDANDRFAQLWFGDTPENIYWRAKQGATGWHGWEKIITSSSIGSQSVNYATSSGSAATATRVVNGTTTPASTQFNNTLAAAAGSSSRVVNFDGFGSTPSVWWTNGSRAYGAIDASDPGLAFWANNGSSWQQQVAMGYGTFNVLTSLRQGNNQVWHAGNLSFSLSGNTLTITTS